MRELLEKHGFEYKGKCKVCNGQAELYKKGNIELKIKASRDFILTIKNQRIRGKLNELEATLEKYLPKETTV